LDLVLSLHLAEKEWWVFWGIIFAACPAEKSGQKLFEQTKKLRCFVLNLLDLSIISLCVLSPFDDDCSPKFHF
jgi:hypothetical protein